MVYVMALLFLWGDSATEYFDDRPTYSVAERHSKCKFWPKTTFDDSPSKYQSDRFQHSISMLREMVDLGFIVILRQASLLHSFRGIPTDRDVDIFLLTPSSWDFQKTISSLNHHGVASWAVPGLDWIMDRGTRAQIEGADIDMDVINEALFENVVYQEQVQALYDIDILNAVQDLCDCEYFGVRTLCFDRDSESILRGIYGAGFMTPGDTEGYSDFTLLFPRWLWRTKWMKAVWCYVSAIANWVHRGAWHRLPDPEQDCTPIPFHV